jgi:hypothetical protein
MYYATDKHTGKELSASTAKKEARWHRFACPCCGKKVFLRLGKKKAPYFAHQPKVASADCENYHPGINGTAGGTRSSPRLPPLSLYLRVQEVRRNKYTWGAELLVPRCPDVTGQVIVDSGISGAIPINCSRLSESGKRIPVRIVTDEYRVRVTPEVAETYRERISTGAPGFRTDVANVFRYTENGGRRIDEYASMFWGRGYYLVWPKALPCAWPAKLWHEEIANEGAWQCSRVEMPEDPDTALTEWANEFVGRNVERPPVELSLVSPPTASRFEDESLLVDVDDEVIVGIFGERGSELPTELTLSTTASNSLRRLNLPDRNPILISLGTLPKGVSTIQINDDEGSDLLLKVARRRKLSEINSPKLLINTPSGTRALPTYSLAAQREFDALRLDSGMLVSVSVPQSIDVTIEIKPDVQSASSITEFRWDPERLARDTGDYVSEFAELMLARLRVALHQKTDLRVDFGPYGSLDLNWPREELPQVQLALTSALRRRLVWSLSLSAKSGTNRVYVPELARSLALVLGNSYGVRTSAESELLREAQTKTFWPVEMIPQLRELAADILHAHKTKL